MSDDSKVTQLPGTSQASRAELPDRVIDALFKDMLFKYGARWADLWAGLPMAEVKAQWARDLGHLDVHTIKRALDSLSGTFPPGLPEFRDLCRQFRPQRDTSNVLGLADRRPPNESTMRKIDEILGRKK